MDVYPRKRGVSGNTAPRKGYNVASRNSANESDQNTQFCNRIGCSGRIKYSQSTKVAAATSDKAKFPRPSCPSSHVNQTTTNPSRSSSVMTSSKQPQLDSKRKLPSQLKFDPSESSSPSSESESSSGYQPNSRKNLGNVTTFTEIGSSSSVSSNIRSQRTFNQKPAPVSSVPPVSRSPTLGTFSSSSSGSRSSLRNVKYNSSSSIVPPSALGKNVMKKRSPEGESSLSNRVRKTNCGISISESGQSSSSASGDSNNTWNRKSESVNTRTRLSSRQNGRNCPSVREPTNERPFNIGGQSSSRRLTGNISSSGSRSFSFSSSNDDTQSARRMPFASSESTFSQLMNRNGIAEVLLALERIEQDEQLTHEQLLALETSLFLSGLNLYDQHRDMRMDIDNMSYEDLLALEEKMGTVSTAVSEEAISKCVRRGIYQSASSELRVTGLGEDGDDSKCSVCQEEYVKGDEIGKLVGCGHGFHETCINQWLRVKNWCPICKASAAPS